MRGRGAIVLRVQQHDFYEHQTVESAITEAKRLTAKLGGEFVVFVPVFSVEKPPEYIVRNVKMQGPMSPIPVTHADTPIPDDDDLPF